MAMFDTKFKEAAEYVVETQQVSTFKLQSKFKIGYAQAARIIAELEKVGIVAPIEPFAPGPVARKVLAKNFSDLQRIVNNYNPNSKPQPTVRNNEKILPYKYYMMLCEVREEFELFIPKLITPYDAKYKEVLKQQVIWDMFTVFHQLYYNKYEANKLEFCGLTLLCPTVIQTKDDANFLKTKNYNDVCMALEHRVFNDFMKSLFATGEHVYKQQPEIHIANLLRDHNYGLGVEYANILYRFAVIIVNADGIESPLEKAKLKEVYKLINSKEPTAKTNQTNYATATNTVKSEQPVISRNRTESTETLDEVLNELNSMIGLTSVKKEINSLLNFIKVREMRVKQGLPTEQLSLHLVFTGNPGTGKTTVARIISKVYKHLGILKQGHLVEVDRADLIAEYVGQTAIKVNKVVDSALNGILFIDEAYSLDSGGSNDYGKEAVAALLKRMEDDRDKLVLIVAGYKNEMSNFIDTNPGFKSRFNKFIDFEDYLPNEMYAIYELQCKRLKYNLTNDAVIKVKDILTIAYQRRDKSFGNGRFVRNLFEKTKQNQSNRIINESEMNVEVLTTIKAEDIPN